MSELFQERIALFNCRDRLPPSGSVARRFELPPVGIYASGIELPDQFRCRVVICRPDLGWDDLQQEL